MLAALTPIQKWQAVRQLNNNIMSDRGYILAGFVTIIVLTILLIAISYHRRIEEQRICNRYFVEYAEKIGLTEHEYQVLKDIATRADLRRNVSIFSMIEAFDRGASRIIEATLALHGIEASKRLGGVVSALRQKLGFEKHYVASLGSVNQAGRPTSKQIPTGKKLYLTCPNTDDLINIESTVVKNDEVQLTIRSPMPLQRSPGEICCVRYCFGGSVWEFDATVLSCQEDVLVLSHSQNVRFINRRRFLRVPVHKPALIAHFPFIRTLPSDTTGDEGDKPNSTDADKKTWGTMDLVPAVVTELAGPGLRVEAALDVEIGERILIIFKLIEENHQVPTTPQTENTQPLETEQRGPATPLKIVEDIGEIRHTEAIQGGFSTGIELTGLSDSDVNELIRATNAASLKDHADTQDVPVSEIEDYEQTVPEPVLTQET